MLIHRIHSGHQKQMLFFINKDQAQNMKETKNQIK